MKLVFTFFIFISLFQVLSAQDLSVHRWKNRLVLLYANSINNPQYLQQIQELKSDRKGIEERKIKVYHFFPEMYLNSFKEYDEKKYNKNFKNRPNEKSHFKIELVGLDGGVKLSSKKVVTFDKLKALIDGMPMRQFELNGY